MDIPVNDPAALEAYCLPFIRGEKRPSTAAELMAARYVAYTVSAIDFLVDTHDPKTRSDSDRDAMKQWAKDSEWQGLSIVSTEAGGPNDQEGKVEFIARYRIDGADQTHHEHATFRRIDGTWFFTDGKLVAKQPIRRTTEKVGRNDPCPCGSQKKYKKCHGAT